MAKWNVQKMLQPGMMWDILGEVKKYEIDLVASQEVRWKGQEEINKSDYTLKYSGAGKQGKHGLRFVRMEKLKANIMEFNAINDRLAYLRIKAKPLNISILNVYAPTETSEKEEKEKFYERLEDEMEWMPREDMWLIMGDFNAQIGKEPTIQRVTGQYTLHKKTNDNGQNYVIWLQT